jgi:hypothetical protein
MAEPLTRAKLDAMGCGMPNCDHDHTRTFLTPRCHVGGPVEAYYDKSTGLMNFRCYECETFIAAIVVGEG